MCLASLCVTRDDRAAAGNLFTMLPDVPTQGITSVSLYTCLIRFRRLMLFLFIGAFVFARHPFDVCMFRLLPTVVRLPGAPGVHGGSYEIRHGYVW